jgi:hypothetical protein
MAVAIDWAQVDAWRAEGLSGREMGRRLGMAPSSFHEANKKRQRSTVPVVVLPPGPPQLNELDTIKADLLEVAQWWRARKMRQVHPREPRQTMRWTIHVDTRWVALVRELAEREGTSQAEIVDRALQRFFEGQ